MVRDNHRQGRWILGLGAIYGAWLVYGCSQKSFEDCSETRSCMAPDETGGAGADGNEGGEGGSLASGQTGSGGAGVGGVADEPGAGGAGGSELPSLPEACQKDEDCDDGKACTGEEACSDGKCEYGADPCPNPDSEHCNVACSEGDSGAECVVTALDVDGDGYGTNECLASPGEDCDDSAGDGGAAHPGALEICNENVDDDCDGLDDSEDDIVLPGIALELVSSVGLGTTRRGEGRVARSYNAGFGFGLAWSDFRHQDEVTSSEIYFRSVGPDGELGSQVRLTELTSAKDKHAPSIIANNAGSYRVVWTYTSVDNSPLPGTDEHPGIAARTTASTASQSSAQPDLVGVPKLAAPGTIFVARNQTTANQDGLYRLVLDSDGFSYVSGSPSIPVPGGNYQSFDASASGGTSFVVASVLDLDGVGKVKISGASVTVPADNVSQTDVVAGGNLFAYREKSLASGESRIVLASATGTLCSVGLPDGIPVALSESAILYWDPEKTALYARVITSASSCTAGRSALVVEQSEDRVISEPDVASEGSQLLVSWTAHDTETDRWSIEGRMFSLELCQ